MAFSETRLPWYTHILLYWANDARLTRTFPHRARTPSAPRLRVQPPSSCSTPMWMPLSSVADQPGRSPVIDPNLTHRSGLTRRFANQQAEAVVHLANNLLLPSPAGQKLPRRSIDSFGPSSPLPMAVQYAMFPQGRHCMDAHCNCGVPRLIHQDKDVVDLSFELRRPYCPLQYPSHHISFYAKVFATPP